MTRAMITPSIILKKNLRILIIFLADKKKVSDISLVSVLCIKIILNYYFSIGKNVASLGNPFFLIAHLETTETMIT